MLPEGLFWVGRVGSSELSTKGYVLDHERLLRYFKGLCEPLPGVDNHLIKCFCHAEYEDIKIPASVVYSSRAALGEWIKNAGIESPDFVLSCGADSQARVDVGDAVFQSKELNYISLIISGLVELIKEVDKAHADQALGEAAKNRSYTIKRRALGLRSVRKNFDPCLAIISLADAAGVDMPKSHKTLKKYMRGRLPSDAGESA